MDAGGYGIADVETVEFWADNMRMMMLRPSETMIMHSQVAVWMPRNTTLKRSAERRMARKRAAKSHKARRRAANQRRAQRRALRREREQHDECRRKEKEFMDRIMAKREARR